MEKIKKIYSRILRGKENVSNTLFGDLKYKKFVIISRSRTGSTLLMALLNKHSQVICEGELFKKLNGKSCLEIWNELYSKKPKRIKHVGFKLFYYHPFDTDKTVWDFIDKDKEVAIVHLTRKNYLEAFVSQKIGEKTKQWSESKLRPHNLTLEQKQVVLEPEECLETFETIRNYERETKERYKNRKFIEIDYGDLNNDKEGTVGQILNALSLSKETLEVVNKKQNKESLQDLIQNYAQLKSYFSNTEWNYLFK